MGTGYRVGRVWTHDLKEDSTAVNLRTTQAVGSHTGELCRRVIWVAGLALLRCPGPNGD